MSVIEQRSAKFFGESCGRHGTYTFYPGLEYNADGRTQHLMLGNFFNISIKSPDEATVDLVGELQLVWHDKNHDEEKLSSVKLYGRPEDCLGGRQSHHGQDEILAEETKVVIRLSDLVDLVINSSKIQLLSNKFLTTQSEEKYTKRPLITSYPQYCRYRAATKRLESVEEKHRKEVLVLLLGRNFVQNFPLDGEVFFCRDTTSLPAVKHFKDKLIHLAPRLKGRKRKKKQSLKFESDESNESFCSDLKKNSRSSNEVVLNGRSFAHKRRKIEKDLTTDKESFLDILHNFMKENHSPIYRSPTLGFKEVDLHQFFISTKKRGGYKEVTKKKLWKEIYDELGGSSCNTSAATGTRKNYERYLQPFENFLNGIEGKGPKKCYKTKTSPSKLSSCNNDSKQILPHKSEPLVKLASSSNNEKASECDNSCDISSSNQSIDQSMDQSIDQSVDSKCIALTSSNIKKEVVVDPSTLSQRLLAGGQALLNKKEAIEVSTNHFIPRNANQIFEDIPTVFATPSSHLKNSIFESKSFDVQDLCIKKNVLHPVENKFRSQDLPLDYSMKTLQSCEESLMKEQQQPLDLSTKKFVHCEDVTPLDLSSRKDERQQVLPILAHLLPLAFAMPSTLQVLPQVMSPIHQNINMIYNPGSVNFPILNFPPPSDLLSPSSR